MSIADRLGPISDTEADLLFAGLEHARGIVLAVSGGPDSTALLWLAARWRHARPGGPAVIAVTVDHALRPESRDEAAAVKRIAKACGIAHRTVRWSGVKPGTGVQKAAREARYRLLAAAAGRIDADHILTAHTRDDQAETLLMRMSRGSGLAGLAGMARAAPVPGADGDALVLLRPFLDVAKARLMATLREAGIGHADDPSNRDPRFARVRMRALMPALEQEGLGSARLAQLARRLRRADAAIEAVAAAWWASHARVHAGDVPAVAFDTTIAALPAEIQLRLLGRGIALCGNEGPVELGKLETLQEAVTAATAAESPLRRTLAGAVVTLDRKGLRVDRAPVRRLPGGKPVRASRDPLNHGASPLPHCGQTALE